MDGDTKKWYAEGLELEKSALKWVNLYNKNLGND